MNAHITDQQFTQRVNEAVRVMETERCEASHAVIAIMAKPGRYYGEARKVAILALAKTEIMDAAGCSRRKLPKDSLCPALAAFVSLN